ncbi:MAG TPA: ABC transporter permease [Leptolyngbya sp.]|jgi:peptide/nickel transport system permease protein|nr:ABC transporter permease [Leptolyngbya sp.]
MSQYILRRLLGLVPVLFGITLAVFLLLRSIPGDPAIVLAGERATPEQIAALRTQLGLDRSPFVQYFTFVGNLLQLQFGNSILSGIPVIDEIRSRWAATFELAVAAIMVAVIIGIPAGVIAAVQKNRWQDQVTIAGSLLGVSLPVYWLGLLLIYLFSITLKWLPPSGRISVATGFDFQPMTGFYVLDTVLRLNFPAFLDVIAHLILPALTLGTIPLAIVARITRSAMLDVLNQDYIRTAKAKGLSDYLVIVRHALKNALLPINTTIGLQFGTLLSGAVLTETIFSWSGIGSWIYEGILARDYPVVQGGVMFVAIVFVFVNLLVDLSYAIVDPRVRYE